VRHRWCSSVLLCTLVPLVMLGLVFNLAQTKPAEASSITIFYLTNDILTGVSPTGSRAMRESPPPAPRRTLPHLCIHGAGGIR